MYLSFLVFVPTKARQNIPVCFIMFHCKDHPFMLNGGKRRAWERSWRQGSFRKGAKKRRQSFPSASQSEYTNMMTYLEAPNPRQHTSQVSWKKRV